MNKLKNKIESVDTDYLRNKLRFLVLTLACISIVIIF